MKLFKLLISMALILLFVQCDSAERRKSKAEDTIEKYLFGILDDFQSYEKIATEVDTLQDLWLANPEIISFAGKLCYVEYGSESYESLSYYLRDKISKLEPAKEPYWCVTQKFRISENGQAPKIHTAHYILDHDMKEIIFSWDENDIRTRRLINLVSGIIIGSNEIFDAVTEDEEL